MARSTSSKWVTIAAIGGAACVGLAWFASSRAAPELPSGAKAAAPEGVRKPASTQRRARTEAATDPFMGSQREQEAAERAENEVRQDEATAHEVRSGAAPRLGGALLDSVDPCEPISEPAIPAELERVKAENVTVAWPPEMAAFEPLSLAHAVAGLLEEAALVTGTPRRNKLVVVLHASRDELQLSTGTPEWASGVYDGFVHVVNEPHTDFGVRIPTLRHEVMHAQLHAAAGCMPAWFNEGTAQYFSGRPSGAAWIKMLREHADFDLDALSVPTIVESPKEDAERLYAQSLAMVLYVVDRSGEDSLQDIVQELQDNGALDRRQHAKQLWRALHPNIDARAIRASLATRLFGAHEATDLESWLQGPVCCSGERRIADFRCRPDAAPPFDRTSEPTPASGRCTRY